MKHTAGLLKQMKNAKPHKTLSKEEIIMNMKEAMKELDNQEQPERRLLMGSKEYDKFQSQAIFYRFI